MEMLYGPHCFKKNAPPIVLKVSLKFLSMYLCSRDVFPTFMSPKTTILITGFLIFPGGGMILTVRTLKIILEFQLRLP